MSDVSIIEFAKSQYEEVVLARQTAANAANNERAREEKLEKDLRAKLNGKTLVISGWMESRDAVDQGGSIETAFDHQILTNRRVVVKTVFVTDARHRGESRKTPLVVAVFEEAHIKNLRAGGLAFRLFELNKLEIVG